FTGHWQNIRLFLGVPTFGCLPRRLDLWAGHCHLGDNARSSAVSTAFATSSKVRTRSAACRTADRRRTGFSGNPCDAEDRGAIRSNRRANPALHVGAGASTGLHFAL